MTTEVPRHGIRELRLNNRGLTQVPRHIFDVADTLEVLDLSGNALTDLPHDFDRLKNLRVLFCSNNRFARLPPVLGGCTALTQIGFRGSGIREVPSESLPPKLRWLTLTDNLLERLPDTLGACSALQKLMLAGNRLTSLPEGLAQASHLELLRVSANRLTTLPAWIEELPRLAWLAWAGNPMDTRMPTDAAKVVTWSELQIGAILGEGSSGRIYRALRRAPAGIAPMPVALKLFKGAIGSDGLPECEMAACLAAAEHPNLIGASGRLSDHPQQVDGLIMPLVPDGWNALAHPPSLESCSRDVYPAGLHLGLDVALRIAQGIGAAAAHLHERRILHGDLYAHNILWDGTGGAAVLSDFGAASFLPSHGSQGIERLEVLAWGILLGELLDRCGGQGADQASARRLYAACINPTPAARPRMAEAVGALKQITAQV